MDGMHAHVPCVPDSSVSSCLSDYMRRKQGKKERGMSRKVGETDEMAQDEHSQDVHIFTSTCCIQRPCDCKQMSHDHTTQSRSSLHFDQSGPIQLYSYSLAHNLSRVDQVLEDGIVDGRKSATGGGEESGKECI